jgi:hypothetical protein
LAYKDGSNTVTIRATDNSGNVGSSTVTALVTNGDLNGDGKVGLADLSIMAANWQKTGQNYAQGDINGDGKINISDFSILANNWGESW